MVCVTPASETSRVAMSCHRQLVVWVQEAERVDLPEPSGRYIGYGRFDTRQRDRCARGYPIQGFERDFPFSDK